jgi:hypothetical protein
MLPILFNLYSEYLTKETDERFGDSGDKQFALQNIQITLCYWLRKRQYIKAV